MFAVLPGAKAKTAADEQHPWSFELDLFKWHGCMYQMSDV